MSLSLESVQKPFEDNHLRIMKLAELILENVKEGESDFLETLRETVSENEDNLNKINMHFEAYAGTKGAIENLPPQDSVNVQQIFEDKMKDGVQTSTSKLVKSFDQFISGRNDLSIGGDESLVMSEQVCTDMLDPWTKMPISNPVKSKICPHVYDKDSVTCQIKTHKKFRCPYIGCMAQLTKTDLNFHP